MNTKVDAPGVSPDREAVARTFQEAVSVPPDGDAIYFGKKTFSRKELSEAAASVAALLTSAGVPEGAPVAWLARNDPGMVASAVGLLMSRRCISVINPHNPAAKVADAVKALGACAVVATPEDWSPALDSCVAAHGWAGLEVALEVSPSVRLRPGLESVRASAWRTVDPDMVLEILTSGTTGEPKRLPLTASKLKTGLSLGIRKERRPANPLAEPTTRTVKRSPALISSPMSHVGGIFRILMSVLELRPVSLRARFKVEDFVEDMRRFRPKAVNLVPAMAAMVLEADVPVDVFRDIVIVRSGTAPLRQDIKRRFEAKYGIPILSEYGASEFFGGVTVWTLADYEKFGAAKFGSVGRPKADVEARILDPESGADLPVGQPGLLTLRSARFGPEWIRTTDLASLDADGFVYIHGRSDQAINRGGFIVLPEKVAEVFRKRPEVVDACVIAMRDDRLGEVPMAVLELRQGFPRPGAEELASYARESLAKYEVPVAFEFMSSLPRTATMKVALAEVKAALKERYPNVA